MWLVERIFAVQPVFLYPRYAYPLSLTAARNTSNTQKFSMIRQTEQRNCEADREVKTMILIVHSCNLEKQNVSVDKTLSGGEV
jgi:hypothetical protein